jgi:hypothetical protein
MTYSLSASSPAARKGYREGEDSEVWQQNYRADETPYLTEARRNMEPRRLKWRIRMLCVESREEE